MSFSEKNAVTVLVGLVLVYSWYFINMWMIADAAGFDGGVAGLDQIAPYLFTTIIAFVVIVAAGHIAFVIYEEKVLGEIQDHIDERDKRIELIGGSKGGFVLNIGVVVTIGLMLLGIGEFWAVNSLMLTLVISEVIGLGAIIFYHRRGV